MNVLIVPEDFRKDQYILKPLFKRLFRDMGKRRVNVRICQEPLLGGVEEALKLDRIAGVVSKHAGVTDIFILCIDRDGDRNRRKRLDRIESEFSHEQIFLAENAWEELETWVLAGMEDLPAEWKDVRAEIQVKETYFEPLVARRNLSDSPGGGRKALGEEASRRIHAIRRKCPDDFDALARRLEAVALNKGQ